jgi:NADP-dependent alcohol dehydrogenase
MVTVPVSPSRDDVLAALQLCHGLGVNVVVAVGGGSAMDAAKLLALAATNPAILRDEQWSEGSLLALDDLALRPSLPVVAVPTTAATGSEVNGVAGITRRGGKRLVTTPWLIPRTAVIDPRLTASLTSLQLLGGGVETLGRILCPFLADDASSPVTDNVAIALTRACMECCDRLAAGPPGLPDRADLAWLTTLSMTQVGNLGRDPWAHVLWYLQSAVSNQAMVPKGLAMAALFPAYLREVRTCGPLGSAFGAPGRLDLVAGTLTGDHVPRPVELGLARRLAGWGLPTSLAGLGLTARRLPSIVAETAEWLPNGFLTTHHRAEIETFYLGALTDLNQRTPGASDAAGRMILDPTPSGR